jgi:hypothetical protein
MFYGEFLILEVLDGDSVLIIFLRFGVINLLVTFKCNLLLCNCALLDFVFHCHICEDGSQYLCG